MRSKSSIPEIPLELSSPPADNPTATVRFAWMFSGNARTLVKRFDFPPEKDRLFLYNKIQYRLFIQTIWISTKSSSKTSCNGVIIMPM